jgi:hypothetical protein
MGNPDDGEVADALLEIADELALFRDAFPRPRPDVTPLVEGEPGYPWAPGTQAQGFLGSRWNRRDGNVYATPATLTGGNDVAQSQSHPSRAGRR